MARTLAAQDATLLAAETKVQTDLDDIAKAQQSAVVAASSQQISLTALSTGDDPSVPAYLAAQSAGVAAVDTDKTSPPIPPALNAAIWAAASQAGVPYVWGGETPLPAANAGFDCSGLVQWAYGQAGITLPRTAQEQHDAVTPVLAAQAQPGDLVFWNDGTTSVQHVAIYVGAGIVLQAPSTGSVVSYAPLWPVGLVGFGVPTVPTTAPRTRLNTPGPSELQDSQIRRQEAVRSMTRQLLVAVATSLPTSSTISAVENATRRPGLATSPVARRTPLLMVTGRR